MTFLKKCVLFKNALHVGLLWFFSSPFLINTIMCSLGEGLCVSCSLRHCGVWARLASQFSGLSAKWKFRAFSSKVIGWQTLNQVWGSSKFGVLGGFTDDDNEASLGVRCWVPCEGSQSYQELKSILPRAILYLECVTFFWWDGYSHMWGRNPHIPVGGLNGYLLIGKRILRDLRILLSSDQ